MNKIGDRKFMAEAIDNEIRTIYMKIKTIFDCSILNDNKKYKNKKHFIIIVIGLEASNYSVIKRNLFLKLLSGNIN